MRNVEIRFIKGVGPQKAKLFNQMGIYHTSDMFLFLPRTYQDRRGRSFIKDIDPGMTTQIQAKIKNVQLGIRRGGRKIVTAVVYDKTGQVQCTWFNQSYLKDVFKENEEYVFYGRFEKYRGPFLQVIHPEFERALKQAQMIHVGRVVPVYPLTQNLTQKTIRRIFYQVIHDPEAELTDMFDERMRENLGLLEINSAIRNIHFPDDFEKLDAARKRIVFSEFFLLQLAIARRRARTKMDSKGLTHLTGDDFIKRFDRALPFELTEGQKKVIEDVRTDLARPKPMNRLLEGDVGSGKTVIASFAILASLHNGYQAAFMAPTEILAEQQYLKLSEFYLSFDIQIGLLVSSTAREEKLKIKEDLKNGKIDIIVGTHALLQEDVLFKNLGLIVIDEQHKFGVRQREILQKKGKNPDVLIMSATPIPRTLALTLYGELDISRLEEKPAGRGEVATFLFEASRRDDVYHFVKDRVLQGEQCFIVCPFIEGESEKKSFASVERTYEFLIENYFKKEEVGLIHGQFGADERAGALKKFRKKEYAVLVSTVMIEVGIDIPEATCMVIESAERFGLSQLHQLRGRIGRGESAAYCLLITDSPEENSKERLQVLVDNRDGFYIAETDLKMRGSGKLFGSKQHGIADYRFGNIVDDLSIMEKAHALARQIVDEDPLIETEKYQLIKKSLMYRFKDKLDLIEVG